MSANTFSRRELFKRIGHGMAVAGIGAAEAAVVAGSGSFLIQQAGITSLSNCAAVPPRYMGQIEAAERLEALALGAFMGMAVSLHMNPFDEKTLGHDEQAATRREVIYHAAKGLGGVGAALLVNNCMSCQEAATLSRSPSHKDLTDLARDAPAPAVPVFENNPAAMPLSFQTLWDGETR